MRRQRGIALVLVLWVTLLLMVLVGSFTLVSRVETLTARNLLDSTRAYYAAEAGLNRAVAALAVTDPERRWKADGRVYTVSFDDAEVSISVVDETGRIDLNAAPREELVQLFSTVRLPPQPGADPQPLDEQTVDRLADAVMDWRDPDDLARNSGAEDADYESAGYPYGAKDAPFESVEELQQVMGMNYEIYRQVEPAVTVYSGRSEINLSVAPREVLMTQPGVTPDMVDQYIQDRQQAADLGAPPPAFPGAGAPVARGGGLTYSVESRAVMPNGASSTLDAVIRMHISPAGRPFSVMRWKENDFSSDSPDSKGAGEASGGRSSGANGRAKGSVSKDK